MWEQVMMNETVETAEFKCELCETDWAFGIRGVCDFGLKQCNCTPGYSGIDDWTVLSSCHVHNKTKHNFHYALFVLATVSVVFSLAGLLVAFRYLFFFEISDNSSDPAFVLAKTGSEQQNTRPGRCSKLGWKIHEILNMPRNRWSVRDIFLYCLFTLLFSISGSLYEATFIFDIHYQVEETETDLEGEQSFSDNHLSHKITLAFLLITSQYACYFLILAWFHNLPDVQRYGNLLGITPFLVEYPNFVCLVLRCGFVFSGIWPILLLVVIPQVHKDENAEAIMKSTYSFLQFSGLTMLLGFLVLGLNLHRLFKQLEISLATNHNASISKKSLQRRLDLVRKAVRTIRVSLTALSSFIVVGTIMMIIFVSVDFIYQYIFFGVLFGSMYFFTIPFQIFILRGSPSGAKPKQKRIKSSLEEDNVVKARTAPTATITHISSTPAPTSVDVVEKTSAEQEPEEFIFEEVIADEYLEESIFQLEKQSSLSLSI